MVGGTMGGSGGLTFTLKQKGNEWSQPAIADNGTTFVPVSFVSDIKKLESVKTPANPENKLAIISFQP